MTQNIVLVQKFSRTKHFTAKLPLLSKFLENRTDPKNVTKPKESKRTNSDLQLDIFFLPHRVNIEWENFKVEGCKNMYYSLGKNVPRLPFLNLSYVQLLTISSIMILSISKNQSTYAYQFSNEGVRFIIFAFFKVFFIIFWKGADFVCNLLWYFVESR